MLAGFLSCLVSQVGCLVGGRHLIVQGRVRADLVVVNTPGFNHLACLLKGGEPGLIQALRTEAAVKGFDIGIGSGCPQARSRRGCPASSP
jgi:hypothetical protein